MRYDYKTGKHNRMFTDLCKYLEGVYQEQITMDLISFLTNVAGYVRETSRYTQYLNINFRLDGKSYSK